MRGLPEALREHRGFVRQSPEARLAFPKPMVPKDRDPPPTSPRAHASTEAGAPRVAPLGPEEPAEHRASAPWNERRLVSVVVAVAALVGLYLAGPVLHVLLAVFAGILLAVLLDALASWLKRGLHTPRGWSLALAIGLVMVALSGAIWLMGPHLANQIAELGQRIPSAISTVKSLLMRHEWSRALLANVPDQLLPLGSSVFWNITGVFSTVLGAVVTVVVALFVGVYLAAEPEVYIEGTVRLLPPARRERGRKVLEALGHALRWWLAGRLAAMTAVGILTWIGLSLAGVPLSAALGLIAGLLSFVPFLGPVLGAIPALLVGLVQSPSLALVVLIVYTAVQSLESYLITPLIQERAVSVPPALPITAQVVLGVLFGLLGLMLATPLAVVLTVLVQMLYIEDVLGDTVKVLGQH
jgi:predicted PurR-regulated permease PerM